MRISREVLVGHGSSVGRPPSVLGRCGSSLSMVSVFMAPSPSRAAGDPRPSHLGYAAGGADLSQPAGFLLSDPRPPAGGRRLPGTPGCQETPHLREQPPSGAVATCPPCASSRDPLDI